MHKSGILVASAILVGPLVPVSGAFLAASAAGPQLSIVAPRHVEVGQPIEIELMLQNAPMVAGYEASVRFDKSASEFAGVMFGHGGSRGNVVSTITSDPAGGVAYSEYTCLTSGCPAPNAAAGRDALGRALVRIEPLQAGRHTVSLDQLKFVDLQGHSVNVDVPVHDVTVDVGSSSSVFASQPVGFTLPSDSAGATPAALDINGNGDVTSVDANELAMNWSDAKRFGTCTVAAADDPNGDGCLDIADLQQIGASPATARAADAAAKAAANSLNQAAIAPWVVNSIGDLPDSNIGNGRCVTTAGDCSLRAAMQEANETPGPDVTNFNIPLPGVQTIQLGGPLPTINDTTGGVTIDGYSQPGASANTDPLASNAVILIEIRGNGSDFTFVNGIATGDPLTGFSGFRVVSANNRIQGLAVYNLFDHFELRGSGATGNVIAGNFIGTNATATIQAPNSQEGGSGVTMNNSANHNNVGTATLADRNVIAGTPSTGVRIQHEGTNNNAVQNTLFGMKPNGSERLPLGFSGVDIQFGAKNNLVGGFLPNEHNVISGARFAGVDLSHQPDTTGNRVVNNFFGTTPAGNSAPAFLNNFYGVAIKDAVEDNFITNNVIGGTIQQAIWVKFDTNGRNFITDNHIGVALDGTPLPNAKYGMMVQGHDFQVGPGNVFANNGLGGIVVTTEVGASHPVGTTVRNRITGNTFGNNNGKMAIDLSPGVAFDPDVQTVPGLPADGPTPNDAGDGDGGPNTLLNYPELAPASTTAVTGTACGDCRVEVYKAVADTFGRGVGQKFIGCATTAANGAYSAALSGISVGDSVAAIAIDALGNTSEFSPLAPVTSGAPVATQPLTCNPTLVSLQPARLLDTRGLPTVDGLFQGGGPVALGQTVELTVTNRGLVPLNADAVALNVTATEGSGSGFVTVYPCGSQRPLTSSLNFVVGQTVANAVIAKVGVGGAVCLFVSAGVQLVVDVTGYVPPGTSFNSLVPARLLDTRAGSPTVDGQFQGGGPVLAHGTVELTVTNRGGIPSDATAVVLNVTVTEPTGSGFVTVYPCGEAFPLASNLNYVTGQTVPNAVISKISADGKVCLFSENEVQLIVDSSGSFAPESSYVPLVPARFLDTRSGFSTVDGQSQGTGLVGADSTLTLTVAGRDNVPGNASAVVLNVTSTQAVGPGFITVYPCDQPRPLASSLNLVPGGTVPNLVIAKVSSTGTVCLYASQGTQLIADVNGYFPTGA